MKDDIAFLLEKNLEDFGFKICTQYSELRYEFGETLRFTVQMTSRGDGLCFLWVHFQGCALTTLTSLEKLISYFEKISPQLLMRTFGQVLEHSGLIGGTKFMDKIFKELYLKNK